MLGFFPSPLWCYSLPSSSMDSSLQDGGTESTRLKAICTHTWVSPEERLEAPAQPSGILTRIYCQYRFLCGNGQEFRTASLHIMHSHLDVISWVTSVSGHCCPTVLGRKCCLSTNVKSPAPVKSWRLDFLGWNLASALSVEIVNYINHWNVQYKVDGSEVFMMVCPSGKPVWIIN